MTSKPDDLVLSLGRVQRPKGLNGEIRVTTFGELLALSKIGGNLDLYRSDTPRDGFLSNPRHIQAVKLRASRVYKTSVVLVELEGFETPESVEKIRGCYFGMPLVRARKEFADPDEPYLFEYVALAVQDADDTEIRGQVVRVEDSGHTQWLIVQLEGAESEIMVPLNDQFVPGGPPAKGALSINRLAELAEAE